MLCEECNKNNATVVITVMAGNETSTRHLCQECVEKLESNIAQGDMSSFLSSLLSILSHQPREEALKCSACGLTYAEFQNSGKLGCAHCYEQFSQQLKPLLHRRQESHRQAANSCFLPVLFPHKAQNSLHRHHRLGTQ